jgi:Domain of unknown function (DUF6438)
MNTHKLRNQMASIIKYAVLFAVTMITNSCSNFGLSTSALPVKPINFSSLTIEAGGCRGACAVYKATILADGKVNYEGYKFVQFEGKAKSNLTKSQVQSLSKAIKELNLLTFDDQRDGCKSVLTDGASLRITIKTNDQRQRIYKNLDCSEDYTNKEYQQRLITFERKIKEVINLSRWTGIP